MTAPWVTDSSGRTAPPPSLAFVDKASEKIVVGEVTSRGASGGGDARYAYMYPDYGIGGSKTQIENLGYAGHLGRWNCLFIDGHVKSLRPVQTGTPLNMWGTMTDNTASGCAHTNNLEAYAQGINCDQVSPGQLAGLDRLEKISN